MVKTPEEIKNDAIFWAWMYLGTGIVRDTIVGFVVGEDWKSINFIETAKRVKEKWEIDLTTMSVLKGMKTIKDIWERETKQNMPSFRQLHFVEEYTNLK